MAGAAGTERGFWLAYGYAKAIPLEWPMAAQMYGEKKKLTWDDAQRKSKLNDAMYTFAEGFSYWNDGSTHALPYGCVRSPANLALAIGTGVGPSATDVRQQSQATKKSRAKTQTKTISLSHSTSRTRLT